jgi:hypothetical protein
MAKALMLFFAVGGGLSVVDWLVAGWIAEANPDAVLAAQMHQSPFFLIVGFVFWCVAMLIAYFTGPGKHSPLA